MHAARFPESLYTDACAQLEAPRLEGGWEFFVESSGIKIHRFYREHSGLYEYKVFGDLPDAGPQLYADVYMDLQYRRTWDSYVKELYERDHAGEKVVYWEVKYPFPLSNRDYVYTRERREIEVGGQTVWVVVAKSANVPGIVEKAGVVRVADYQQSLALTSNGKHGTKVFMHYYDNPGGMIPSWLINWAAKSGVPAFLTDMQKACRGYRDYCQKAGKPL
ncbi:phosphatidylcholine transfer protein isoform X1 [Petromyzon marinus]|uniref:Phosphatidylcholine transfer protein n=1 Tax=Petromyzon marinus TaxID=7757 RepID=A0AAJ7TSJ1_PETMA|nr:phosphatidylcholine transfer protein [Petromyzon marinus]